MKSFIEVYSFVSGIPKQINFQAGTEISSYNVEMRDEEGNNVLLPIPPATRLSTGFLVNPDITVNNVTVRVLGI